MMIYDDNVDTQIARPSSCSDGRETGPLLPRNKPKIIAARYKKDMGSFCCSSSELVEAC